MRAEDKDAILRQLQERTITQVRERAAVGGPSVEEVVAGSVYWEGERLREWHGHIEHHEREFWQAAQRRLVRASERSNQLLMREVVERYGEEIAGHFDERVYNAITRAGEPVLGALLNATSPLKFFSRLPHLPRIEEAIVVQGEVEQLRRLHELGTVLLVPTHVSHMDSIIVGYVLWRMGLPPFVYGAGLNLFSNPLLGFFLRHLGAYTVDRRKKDPLYKQVLKNYTTLTLEHGYDNIFFPGGTRARSGGLERHVKLGLLGTGVVAYANNLLAGKLRPRVFIVPATLSFQLVLEAETLIDDFLKEVGKARYIISDDEFSQPRQVLDFVRQLLALDSKIFFTIGRGLDPFGNDVDEAGESLDPHGRAIDASRYLWRHGQVATDAARDAEFTRELSDRLVGAYARDNVVQTTHVTARAIFSLLRRQDPALDVVRLVRAGGRSHDVELGSLYDQVERLTVELQKRAVRGELRLAPQVARGSAEDIVASGLSHFGTYHSRPAAVRKGDRVFAGDRALLFYYHNRLEGYGLEKLEGVQPALSLDHRRIGQAA